jgi:crossover junction endodeoxyribonuclease RuvC
VGITARQFEELQQRTNGRRRVPAAANEAALGRRAMVEVQAVLGVDPSLRGTGYGIIRMGRSNPQLLAQGTIRCPTGWQRSRCLVRIATALREAIQQHRPAVCVVEGLFYAQNFQTALILGEARGAALVAIAEAGLPIFEMAPRKVKQAIVGYGAAQKLAVARMVQRMLALPEPPGPDAADALALALAYAQEMRGYRLTSPKRI